MQTDLKQKLSAVIIGLVALALPFSLRQALITYSVIGTDVVNDFTTVFLFGIDIVIAIAAVSLFAINFKTPTQNKKIFWLYALLLSWVILASLMTSTHTLISLSFILRFILSGILLISLLKIPQRLSLISFSIGFTVAGLVQSLIAILQFVVQQDLNLTLLGESPLEVGMPGVATFTLLGHKLLRAYGTLPHPNILALFLVISLLAITYLYKQDRDKKDHTLILSLGLINLLALILTFSRLYILLAGFVFCIWLYQRLNLSRRLKISASIILILITVGGILMIRPINKDDSYTLRNLYNRIAISSITENPTFGIGAGQSVLLSNQNLQTCLASPSEDKPNSSLNYQSWMHQPAHNSFLLLATEIGLLGLFIFLTLLWLISKTTFSQNQELFLKLSFMVIVAGMFFEHMFFTSPNIFYLSVIILGLCAIEPSKLKDK